LDHSGVQVDVAETNKEVKVSAELPGVDEADIDVRMSDGLLVISKCAWGLQLCFQYPGRTPLAPFQSTERVEQQLWRNPHALGPYFWNAPDTRPAPACRHRDRLHSPKGFFAQLAFPFTLKKSG